MEVAKRSPRSSAFVGMLGDKGTVMEVWGRAPISWTVPGIWQAVITPSLRACTS